MIHSLYNKASTVSAPRRASLLLQADIAETFAASVPSVCTEEEFWYNHHTLGLDSRIPVSYEGHVTLGAPGGSPSFIEGWWSGTVAELTRLCHSLIPSMGDTQCEYLLLAKCALFPRYNFSLRSCPPSSMVNTINQLDLVFFFSFFFLFNII